MKDLKNFKNITILSGAGLSQESGIKTFRDSNGLWENHPIEEVASPEGFRDNPKLVQTFYNLRRKQLFEVEPNLAHTAIAELANNKDKNLTIITQNVDDLHERAGARDVIHMHGELRKIRNIKTGESKYFEGSIEAGDYDKWRPDIVWFGEQIKDFDIIHQSLQNTEVFMAVGTSSQVFPAAQFFQFAKENGAYCIELNLEKTQMSSKYDLSIQGKASKIVPDFINKYINE